MANYFANARRRTKSSVISGRKCELWLWFIFSVSLPYVCARSFEEDSVSIYPDGDINVRYGDNLEMFCTAGGNSTADDLVFTKSKMPLPSVVVNRTTRRLFIEKPEENPRQTYYCRNTKTDKNALKSVVVASPPANVTDFKCISRNIDVLNCSWTTPDKVIFTHYNLTFQINGGNTVTSTTAMSVDGTLTRYCVWTTNSDPRYRQLEEKFYVILDAKNVFDTNRQYFTIDHYSIVKPDPPENLQNISVSPHSVYLQWNLPVNMFDFLKGGIEHKIEYQIAKIDDKSYFRRVNTTGLPINNRTYRFNLTDLPYAHMQYGVRVYIKPIRSNDSYWSDFSNLVFYTSSERPNRPPEMGAGAFQQNKFQTYRRLQVYWKQLNDYEEAGANFTYKVLVRQGTHTDTLFPDKNKSLGFLVFDRASLSAMEVTVWSFNEKGSSQNSSQLYIPSASETNSLDLTSFTKLAYENGTYELSWFGIDNIDNYTLFWCQHNTTDQCYGRIDFTVLPPTKNKHVINLSRDYRYQFAISANRKSKSSGMMWAKCDISKEEIGMYRFPIEFTDHDAPGKSFVKLKWSMDCILKDGIIIGYNISYCPVIETSVFCDKTGKNHSKYIDNPKQFQTTIENLEPYRTYQFTMALNTTYGPKTIDNTTVRITTLEDTPTQPRNVQIADIKNDSLTMLWERPEHINGHISKIKYVIYNNRRLVKEVKYEDKLYKNMQIKVKLNVLPFTNYSLSVQACNEGIDSCSLHTEPVTLRSCIGAPSKLKTPTFEDSSDSLTWVPPEIPGGTVDQYQISITKDDKESEIVNTTNLIYPLAQCEGTKNLFYQVRAVNFDEDINHGAASVSDKVMLPKRTGKNVVSLRYVGEWSDRSSVRCRGNNMIVYIIILGVLALVGAVCVVVKFYKKVRKMRDIKPEYPKGLFVPAEKDITKYPYKDIYSPDKDEKATTDETLLLPNSKKSVSTSEIKQSDNCGSSDHTDSTALSDTSQGPIDRQNSTSTTDNDSNSSLRLEGESRTNRPDMNALQDGESSNSETDSCHDTSPYFSDSSFKKNPIPNPVQPVVNPATGYVTNIAPLKSVPSNPVSQPSSSSYIKGTLLPPVFSGLQPRATPTLPPPSLGYVRAEDIQPRSEMNFPKLGPSPTKIFGSESLPATPILPTPAKNGDTSNYIQLQSLDSLASQKPTLRNVEPLKTSASNGYVCPEDAVINKHLKNIMSGPLADEGAILDPAMSPEAYCRFSWSTDRANDNLNSLLGNSSIHTSKN